MRVIHGCLFALGFLFLSVPSVWGQANAVALPVIESVDYDEQARFRVNGRPFFPILLYGAPTDDTTLAQLRDFGFNTLTCRPDVCVGLPAQGFYGAVHSAKQTIDTAGVLLALGTDSPALYFKKNLLEQVAVANAKTAAAIPGRPVMNAIGYWEDEPAGVVAGKLPSQAMYEDLAAALDVAAPYLYPVPYQPVASVGEAVARARKATAGKKPILPILQLFAWEKDSRYPTPTELRCMTFLALVEGASGVGYYSYGSVTGRPKATIAEVQPELWQSVRALNREVAEIGPQLLDGNEAAVISLKAAGAAVKYKAARRNDGFPAVLVNSTEMPQKAKLVLQPGTTHDRLYCDGDRHVEFKGGVAEVALQPLEVLILRRFDKQPSP